MALTFQNLQDRVISYGYGEADRALIKQFLNEALEDVVGAFPRWSWLFTSATVTCSAGTATVTVPTAVVTFARVVPNQASIQIPKYVDFAKPEQYNVFAKYETATGVPQYYGFNASGQIVFSPIPDAAYAYKAYYWKGRTLLSANSDEPDMNDNDRPVLVQGALARLERRNRNFALADYYQKQFDEGVQQMIRTEKAAQTQTPKRARMPDHYGGLFDA